MSCFIFHNWGKWMVENRDYIGTGKWNRGQEINRRFQVRICQDCGKVQEERIYD